MKKLLFLPVFLMVSLFFAGCLSQAEGVVKMAVYVNDQTANASLEVVPNYDKRTLEINYKKDELKTNVKDEVAATGQVGGEYFDRFEKAVMFVKKNGGKNSDGEKKNEKEQSVLKIVVENADKNVNQVETYWNDPAEGLEDIRSFYLDVSTLLTESEQV